jgi:hypothetical protein
MVWFALWVYETLVVRMALKLFLTWVGLFKCLSGRLQPPAFQ